MIHIYHHDDLDGRCSAAIASHYYKKYKLDVEFHEVGYKDKIDVNDIQKDDLVIVVDFSFKPETMKEFREKASKVIWCDHHITAKDYGYDDLPGYRDFSEKGLAGCECTWKHFFPDKRMPKWVMLIGDYDSWRMILENDSVPFYEGMKLTDTSPKAAIWGFLLADDHLTPQTINGTCQMGGTAIIYRDNYCANLKKSYAYETEIAGHKALAMNVYAFGSKAFGEDFEKYPICIAYIYDGNKYTVSLYSKDVDVSVIAKDNGGGGHKGAAGFICEELPFKRIK
jgi:oligoribonuclease NrnB/cAMP/cGMP phosphodiesterase (DHH superfamily)